MHISWPGIEEKARKVFSDYVRQGENSLDNLLQLLREEKYSSFNNETQKDDNVRITTPESVLEIKVNLTNKPGSLATFARLLGEYRANVIYMLYNESINPESADIALATENPEEVSNLLSIMNSRGYSYRVVYRGSDTEEIERIIGLKLVEKFFLRLRKLVSEQDVQQVMGIVDSSKKLYTELVNFYSEVGDYPEKGNVFSNILAFASTSVTKTGENFRVKELPPLEFEGNIRLLPFRLPTGANIFVFQHNNEITMFDAGYGLYYEDIKNLFKKKGIDPASVRRIFVSHADADHIGGTGYFAEEFNTQVFVHPDSKGIMDNENRAYGTSSKLSKLNKHFTVLVNRLTKCKYPGTTNFFSTSGVNKIGAFSVIDIFSIGNLRFQVLESHGGHVPDQVFFVNKKYGLFFTFDYLINVESLSDEEKDYMKLPRYLMTSTNTNSQLFREETKYLIDIASLLDKELEKESKAVLIFPGHGDWYQYRGKNFFVENSQNGKWSCPHLPLISSVL